MFDLNLAMIDVSAAWVCVALPRMAQARLLSRWGQFGYGQENRLRPDPVQHMSLVGTLAVPAVISLVGIPVIAWGKDFDDTTPPRSFPRAAMLVLATSAMYLLQALAFVLLMMILAKVYLAGAPVAARAGQLSLRMAMLSLLALPVLDAGLAWRYLVPWQANAKRAMLGAGAIAVGLMIASPLLQRIDGWAQLGFFYLAQWLPQG